MHMRQNPFPYSIIIISNHTEHYHSTGEPTHRRRLLIAIPAPVDNTSCSYLPVGEVATTGGGGLLLHLLQVCINNNITDIHNTKLIDKFKGITCNSIQLQWYHLQLNTK